MLAMGAMEVEENAVSLALSAKSGLLSTVVNQCRGRAGIIRQKPTLSLDDTECCRAEMRGDVERGMLREEDKRMVVDVGTLSASHRPLIRTPNTLLSVSGNLAEQRIFVILCLTSRSYLKLYPLPSTRPSLGYNPSIGAKTITFSEPSKKLSSDRP